MSPVRTLAVIACAAVLIGAHRDTDEQALARVIGDRVPGTPVDCIDPHNLEGPTIINKRTIVYRGVGTVYRNDLASECRPLTESSTLIVEINGGQICEHDHFRTREPGDVVPSQFCFFGKFTPYAKPRH